MTVNAVRRRQPWAVAASFALSAALSAALVAVGPLPAPAQAEPGGSPSDVAPAAASVPTAPTGVSYATTKRRGRAAVRDALRETDSSSVSLAVVAGDRIVWQQAFGSVDTAGTRPRSTTRYGIGSVSKMAAAIAVLQLVDAGRVSLDAPVVTYVPDFVMASPGYRQITVRMLLDHSAGLPGSDYRNASTTVPYPAYSEDFLRALRTQRLVTTPGALSVYCNDCFTLAGIVVERVSGLPFTDYVQQEVFDPLGMADSAYPTTLFPAGTWAPLIGDAGPLPQEVLNVYAAGAMWSTPADMSRLARMLMGGGVFQGRRILSENAIAQMATLQLDTTLQPVVQSEWRFGLGWDSVQDPGLAQVGVLAWSKGGDAGDYHAEFLVAPDEDLAVTVLGAGRQFSSSVAHRIAQQVMVDALVDQGELDRVPPQVRPTSATRVRPTKAQLRRITGTYVGHASVQRVTARRDGRIDLAALTGGEFVRQQTLALRSDGRFWTADGMDAVWAAPGWGRTYLVERRPNGMGTYRTNLITGQRLTPSATSPAWQGRAGKAWLLANSQPIDLGWMAPGAIVSAIPGAPGYVVFSLGGTPLDAGADGIASAFVHSPAVFGRDMSDVDVIVRDGQDWLRSGSYVMRPLDGVPVLPAGSSTVPIGPEGYAEWWSVPIAGQLSVSGATDWKVYGPDSDLAASGSGPVAGLAVTAGSYLVVFGPASSSATVTLS